MLSAAVTILLLALHAPIQVPDTTISVPEGGRLDVSTRQGEIVVRTWARDQVGIQMTEGSEAGMQIRTVGSVVRVRPQSDRSGGVSYAISIPATLDLLLGGVNTQIEVEGSRGQVRATSVNGSVRVTGGLGPVSVQTVNGQVEIENATGNVDAQTVSGNVLLRGIRGAIEAQSVSGTVVLERIEANSVGVASVSGRIVYDGTIASAGTYSFASHSGDITLRIQRAASATLAVTQMSGSMYTALPMVTAPPLPGGHQQRFILGGGSAELEVETFSGRVRVEEREAPPQ